MKSALFVDFDNVYSQLCLVQPEAAERFARHPLDWIGWLTESLALPEPHDENSRRRLLVRRCYLNPNWYQNYRHAFLLAGFEIVDCPPVTSQGKTSTDIHRVLDIVDLLQHETRYDEFIVFSADADFTPVPRKLRRFDRRTTVLAIGFPSAAYQASADLLIDERVFLREALGIGRVSSPGSAEQHDVGAGAKSTLPSEGKPALAEPKSAAVVPVNAKAEAVPKVNARLATPVVVPLFADQPYNARAVEDAGAGVAVLRPEAASLRSAIQRVLNDASLRAGAGRIADEMSTMASMDEAAGALLALARATTG